MPTAAERVERNLGESPGASWFHAPGRVNLVGDHTDYNDGFVLPIAIDRECVVAAVAADVVRVTSLDVEESVEVHADGSAAVESVAPGWGRLVAAVVQELARLGRPPAGMDAVLASDVPIGSGLSSSAAFEVALAVSLSGVAGWEADGVAIARACRAAEEKATGVPCGIMDQLISVAGRAGHAQLIDCRSLELTAIPLPERLRILVVYSGQARTLATSAYEERRRACEGLARKIGVAALRDAGPADVVDDPLGRHVVSENERVLDAARALEDSDLDRFGVLLSESHASMRDDFRISTPALDALVEALVEAGALGARLTGGGFGGAVVAACHEAGVDAVASSAADAYRRRTGLEPHAFVCAAVGGAGRCGPPASHLDVRQQTPQNARSRVADKPC